MDIFQENSGGLYLIIVDGNCGLIGYNGIVGGNCGFIGYSGTGSRRMLGLGQELFLLSCGRGHVFNFVTQAFGWEL